MIEMFAKQIVSLGTMQTMLMAAVVYLLPLEKQSCWKVKLVLGSLLCMLLIPLIKKFNYMFVAFCSPESFASNIFKGMLRIAPGVIGDSLIHICLIAVIFLACSYTNILGSFFVSACCYITQDFAYTLFVLLFPYAANRSTGMGQRGGLNLVLAQMGILLIVYIIFYFIFGRKFPEKRRYELKFSWTVPMIFLIIHVGKMLGAYSKIYFDVEDSPLFRVVLVYDLFLTIFVLGTHLIQTMETRAKEAAEREAYLRNLQHRQYRISKESMDIINHKCHDLKHQVAAFNHLLDGQKKEEVLEEWKRSVSDYDSVMHTDNDALDALLTEKWRYCESADIQWTCVADGRALDFIDPVDLYTLLGNALDNAIEAVKELKEPERRFLALRIKRQGELVFLQIENYCVGGIAFQDGCPLTTKENKEEHGFGIQSIRFVVEKYHGYLNMSEEDNIFTLSILFSYPKE